MVNEEEILKELRKLTKIITISNGKNLESELEKYATSGDRKKIWVLIDGKKQADEISKIIGITKRAVDIFLKILEDAGLVERPFNKPPMRILDYVPAELINMVQIESKQTPAETVPQTAIQNNDQKSEGVTNG